MENEERKVNIKNDEEKVTDVKGTIVGFIAPDPVEKTQEQEIQEFEIKKETDKELAKLSEEEQKLKKEEYEKEEKRLEKIKNELLESIRKRIPAIEKRFKLVIEPNKKEKVVQKVKSQTLKNVEQKDAEMQKNKNNEEKERE